MSSLRSIRGQLQLDNSDYVRKLRQSASVTDDFRKQTTRTSRGMVELSRGIKTFTAVGVAGLFIRRGLEMANTLKQMAIDANESRSAFGAVFGEGTRLNQFVEDFANKAGLADFELQDLLATTGNFVIGLGAAGSEAEDFAQKITEISGDIASFRNVTGGTAEVSNRFQSAMAGNTEALRGLGIVVTQAEVTQRALQDTQKENVQDLTKLERAYATYAVAVERAGKANGDLERTQDEAANAQRRQQAEIREAMARIGEGLVPAFLEFGDAIVDSLPAIERLAASFATIAGDAGDAAASTVRYANDLLVAADAGGVFLGFAGRLVRAATSTDISKWGDAFGFLGSEIAGAGARARAANLLFNELAAGTLRSASSADKFTIGLEILRRNGGLTVETYNQLLAVSGATTDEIEAGIGIVSNYAGALDDGGAALDRFQLLLRATGDESFNMASKVETTTTAFNAQSFASMAAGVQMQARIAQIKQQAQAERDQIAALKARTRATRDATLAQKEALDPAFAAIRAQQRLETAQARLDEVRKDSKSTSEDVAEAALSVAEAQAEANVMAQDFAQSAGPNATGAMEEFFRQAGLTEQEIGLLNDELSDLLTNLTNISNGVWTLPNFGGGDPVFESPSTPATPAPAPFDPSDLISGLQSTTVVVESSGETPQDVQEGLALAGITEFVERTPA